MTEPMSWKSVARVLNEREIAINVGHYNMDVTVGMYFNVMETHDRRLS